LFLSIQNGGQDAHGCRANICVHLKTKWRANALVAALIFVFIKTKWRANALVAALIFVFISKQNGEQMHWLPH
jgi:hypothetical protein